MLYRKFEQRNRKSYSLKNKYRNCGSESKDKLTFADEYALEEFPANSFATLDPGILRNRPDPGATPQRLQLLPCTHARHPCH